jgi:hypothetical protein
MKELLNMLESKREANKALKAISVPVAYTPDDVKRVEAAYRKALSGPLAKAKISVSNKMTYVDVRAELPAKHKGISGTLVLSVYREQPGSGPASTMGVAGIFSPEKNGIKVEVIPERTLAGSEETVWPVDPQEFGNEAARVAVRRLRDVEQAGVSWS